MRLSSRCGGGLGLAPASPWLLTPRESSVISCQDLTLLWCQFLDLRFFVDLPKHCSRASFRSFQVHVEFLEVGDKIKVEGPPEEVEKARESLEQQAQELVGRMSFCDINVDAKYHKHIIGKGGSTGEFFQNSKTETSQISQFVFLSN